MTTLDEHTPALDQLSKPASKSQQQTWAQDLLDTIQTNRDNHRDNHRRPTASLSRPHPQNEAEIQTLTAELMANVDSERTRRDPAPIAVTATATAANSPSPPSRSWATPRLAPAIRWLPRSPL